MSENYLKIQKPSQEMFNWEGRRNGQKTDQFDYDMIIRIYKWIHALEMKKLEWTEKDVKSEKMCK